MTVATCSLSLECGISTRSWRARAPFRMRVSMSAIGSVIMGSPACLDHARDFAAEREHPKANPAELELAVIASWPPAHLAAVVMTHDELGPAVEFRKLRSTRHGFPLAIRSRGR